jgi:hypothetical protein
MRTPEYCDTSENLAFTRDYDAALVLRFRTNGRPGAFTGQTHSDFTGLPSRNCVSTPTNQALVITGTGDTLWTRRWPHPRRDLRAGGVGAGSRSNQLGLDRERGLAVANGSRFSCPRREISSTRLESPRERR